MTALLACCPTIDRLLDCHPLPSKAAEIRGQKLQNFGLSNKSEQILTFWTKKGLP